MSPSSSPAIGPLSETFFRTARHETVASNPFSAEVFKHAVPAPLHFLDALEAFLKSKQIRFIDLFRSRQYNPSVFSNGDDTLDEYELQEILNRAGLQMPLGDILALIDSLDTDGNRKVDLAELDAAYRAHRRKKHSMPTNAVQQLAESINAAAQKPKKAKLRPEKEKDYEQQPQTCPCAGCGRVKARMEYSAAQWSLRKGRQCKECQSEGPNLALSALARYLRVKRMRAIDLFRSKLYNPSYSGDDLLDDKEVFMVLKRVGVKMALEEVQNMIRAIDKDGNQQVDIHELDVVLRHHYRGLALPPTAFPADAPERQDTVKRYHQWLTREALRKGPTLDEGKRTSDPATPVSSP